MEIRLDGRVALVTGAGSGIGQGIASTLAEAGADIVVNYHSEHGREGADKTGRAVEVAGRRAHLVVADIGQPDDVNRMFDTATDTFGKVDILVNNAAYMKRAPALTMSFDHWEQAIRTNLTGAFLCSQRAANDMLKRNEPGVIVNISSVHEEAPNVVSVAYTASKGGLRNLTRSLALELAPHGIRVLDVAPGMINTKMSAEAGASPAEFQQKEQLVPLRRAGQPKDVAEAIVYLVSDHAGYLTGSTVFVDGGWMLTWPDV